MRIPDLVISTETTEWFAWKIPTTKLDQRMHLAPWSPDQAGAKLEHPFLSQAGEGTVWFTSPSSALENFILQSVICRLLGVLSFKELINLLNHLLEITVNLLCNGDSWSMDCESLQNYMVHWGLKGKPLLMQIFLNCQRQHSCLTR